MNARQAIDEVERIYTTLYYPTTDAPIIQTPTPRRGASVYGSGEIDPELEEGSKMIAAMCSGQHCGSGYDGKYKRDYFSFTDLDDMRNFQEQVKRRWPKANFD